MVKTDTFEDGTTQNWVVGLLGAPHPAPPVNISTGGPAGSGDNYLLLTAVGGSGSGSRLSVINLTQWGGDYLAAGVNAISMDLNNLGTTDLYLRLLLADPIGGSPNNLAFSTTPVFLPSRSSWTSVVFPIGISPFTAWLGSVTEALTNDHRVAALSQPECYFSRFRHPSSARRGQYYSNDDCTRNIYSDYVRHRIVGAVRL